MKFIYALSQDDRKELLSKGFKELFSCNIGDKTAYAFDINSASIAMFDKENKKKFLFTNIAYFS